MSILKLNAIWVLAKRELRSTFYGLGIYLNIFVSLIISSVILQNYLRTINREWILITSNPIYYALFIATAISSLYLSLTSAISIAREKDMQTLEVLYYGPVDHTSFILSKFIKGLLSYLFIILFLVIYFAIASYLSNFGLSVRFAKILFLSFFLSSCMISFGILISTLTKNVRTSVLLFIGIIGGLISIHIAIEILIKMNDPNLSPSLIYLRNTLLVINAGVKWFSPFYYLKEGIEAVTIGSGENYTLSIIFLCIYTTFIIILSIVVMTKKGVRKIAGE